MYFKYRGFHKTDDGSITIYIDNKSIQGEWVYGLVVGETDEWILIKTKNGETVECIKETVGAEIPYIRNDDEKPFYEGDIVQFYTTHKPTSVSIYWGPVPHTGELIYNNVFGEFMLDADIYYSFSNVEGGDMFLIGNKFELIEDKDYEKR